MFKIGEKVRFLHGREEAVVTRILGKHSVEVEIEDGFGMEVSVHELVKVDAHELKYFNQGGEVPQQKTKRSPEKHINTSGVLLAMIEKNDRLECYLINDTDLDIYFSLNRAEGQYFRLVNSGHIRPQEYKLTDTLMIRDHNVWPEYEVQYISFYDEGNFPAIAPVAVRIKVSKKILTRKKANLPILNTDGYTIYLDQKDSGKIHKTAIDTPDPEKIKEALFEKEHDSPSSEMVSISSVVDLHWEMLPDNFKTGEHLKDQLNYLNYFLDQSLVHNLPEVTVIHGIGNHILKKEVQRILSRHPHVRYYEDANKGRFGAGAARVIFKD